ncbi:phage minor head protein [Gracilimonas tropica]|uniref:phage minor head protein n=1 Tax=Gracilimonas tropica TaxID=454600 RepID=UPI00036D16F3|nr:phage minor head protein [Gracilimonas tropica]
MPELPDLSGIFNRTPEAIVEQFRSKGYAVSWNWRDTWQEANTRAFTVAKAVNQNVLEAIRGEVDNALANGTTFRDFQRNLQPKLEEMGWWGRKEIVDPETGEVTEVQLGSPHRLKTIYRTNLSTSYSAGRYRSQIAAANRRPWWIYRTAGDQRVREEHDKLAGTVVRYDDPFWITHYPPNDWGCRCGVDSMTDAQLEARGLTPTSGENIDDFAGEGWNYNPGAAPWDPLTPRQTSLQDILPVNREPFDIPGSIDDLPIRTGSVMPEGQPVQDYVGEFLQAFGASRSANVFRDKAGDPVVVSEALFKDPDGNLQFPGGEYAQLAADTLQEPAEIWLNWLKIDDQYKLNRRYVSRFDLDGDEQFLSFDIMDGHWLFRLLSQTEADQLRTGFLRYKTQQ